MEKASRTPNREKTLEQSQTESCFEFSGKKEIFAREHISQREKEQKIFRASEESELSYGLQPNELIETNGAKDPMVAPQDYDVHQSVSPGTPKQVATNRSIFALSKGSFKIIDRDQTKWKG